MSLEPGSLDLAALVAAVGKAHAEPAGVVLRRLGADEVPAFAGLTFPAYRAPWAQAPAGHRAVGLWAPDGSPAGLALAERRPQEGHLLSLQVLSAHRNQGWATALLAELEAWLTEEGALGLGGTYSGEGASVGALERVFAKRDWSLPVPNMLLYRVPLEGLKEAPWMRHAELAEGDELKPWGGLSPAERTALWDSLQAEAWVSEDLHPDRHEAGCDPQLSLALLRRGEVVGWAIGRGMGGGLYRLDSGWVRPELQKAGRLFALYAQVGFRALDLGFTEMSWTVPLTHGRKAAFARRWMAPGFSPRTSYRVGKPLTGQRVFWKNRAELEAILPHRAPFALLDGLLACEPGKSVVAVMRVNPRDPILDGHFPGEPIYPGVMLVEAMAQAVVAMMKLDPANAERTYLFGGADGVRFKRPVRPGEVVVLQGQWVRGAGRAVVAETVATVDGEEVARATLIAGSARGEA